MIAFGSYSLDLDEERLWKGGKLLALRRKPFAILRYLASHPRRLVTHQELLAEVWGGAVVSESAMRSHLHDLRQVLGEGVIETVIGRGYRFVAEPSVEAPAPVARPRVKATARPERLVVSREAELEAIRSAFDRAAQGRRAVCFVSGDPGIGKTTLVDTFLDELEDRGVLAVRGNCVEQFGTPEAYLAMIEVIGKLRRSERGDEILAVFARYAPTFLAKVPHLVPDEMAAEVARRAQGGSEARMVRELVEALEVAAGQEPIVLVIEDLQWSDLATIDLLALLAQRSERAKLMLIGTARRAAIQTTDHPLSRVVKTLCARAGAQLLAPDRIELAGIKELVARRFPGHAFPDKLIDVIAGITGGTPLFLVTLLDDLTNRGMLAKREDTWELTVSVADVAAHRPDSITQLIDIQLDRLTGEEQRMLEAASLVGAVFDTGSVAGALEMPIEQVDDLCDDLARRGLFLRREASEDRPDGTVVSRYAMTHSLVQEVCEARGSAARRQRWHLAIANHLERVYAGATQSIAHVLAAHLEKAGAASRAVEYYMAAGLQMSLRFASADAVASYERARALLPRVPRTRERDARELEILATIGQLLIRTPYQGGDPLHVYERAVELAREIGDVTQEYTSLASLLLRRTIHAELELAASLANELVALEAKHELHPLLVEYGKNVRAFSAIYRAEVVSATEMFESMIDGAHRAHVDCMVVHPTSMLGPAVRTAVCLTYSSIGHIMLGAPDKALRSAQQAVAEAQEHDDRIALGMCENFLARVHYERRDPLELIERAALAVVRRGTAGWVVAEESRALAAWAEAHRTPITAEQARALVDYYRGRLAKVSLGAPNMAGMLSETLWMSGHHHLAREVIEMAIPYAEAHRELLFMPELLRFRGDYIAASEPAAAAAVYREAYTRALAYDMPFMAMRAAIRIARAGHFRDELRIAIERCAEQAATPDFLEARALLS